jgi:hypothetical protein
MVDEGRKCNIDPGATRAEERERGNLITQTKQIFGLKFD